VKFAGASEPEKAFANSLPRLNFEAGIHTMSEDQSKSTSLINLEDLAGLGAVGTRIVDAAKEAFGALWRPVRLKEEADGEAYRITAVARAEAERHRVLSEVDEELVARANQRLLSQEIQRQENLEAIVKESLRQSIENDHKHADQPELDDAIDPDWMVRFRNLAQDISHSGMQKVWGQVLESEARRPGSYSFRGLDCLSHMRHADAELFQKACNLAFDNCRIFLTKDTDPPGGVQGFLTYNEILLLRAMALIHDDPSTIFVCSPAPKSGQL
jgi:hypothetical protein